MQHMILGDTCTRACAFCNVKTGKPSFIDHGEAIRCRVSEAIRLNTLCTGRQR